MRDSIIRTCKRKREERGVPLWTVGAAAGRDQSVISRFEGSIGGVTWPRNMNRIVAAYAEALGLPEQELWADAVKMWGREHQLDISTDYASKTGAVEQLLESQQAVIERVEAIAEDLQEMRALQAQLVRSFSASADGDGDGAHVPDPSSSK